LLTPQNIITLFEEHGLPNYGVFIDFLPSDPLMEDLTRRFKVEFALMFKINGDGYNLFAGEHNNVSLPVGSDQILIKHTHPRGTPHPSYDDIIWLTVCQDHGSPQLKSIILPIGRNRIVFYKDTPYLN
jgi:hypothetical protein